MELHPASKKIGTGSYQREKMELDPTSGKRWNWILPAGKDGTGSCQQENWNWILPARKDGTGSCQRENMELYHVKGKLGTTVDPASGKTYN